ncbi:hypothetical protein GCM10009733_046320 [Nonomuraea maheshkhaliensis]|uniref:AB hydrolase-1 domain-containing protein n=1 Tax=Nonomuraea maheshkhaliensis TaxID=419590 RepID=A0ABN2FFP1_9ACTN
MTWVVVPGARLHVERTGIGPALLVSGGGGDAGMYVDVIPLLARAFTVIAYDRRGNSRSPFTEPRASIAVNRQTDDAIAVLDHYGFERAYVFGNSSGAIIALEMVARHAGRLLGAVAHEPPLVQLLAPDSRDRVREPGAVPHPARAGRVHPPVPQRRPDDAPRTARVLSRLPARPGRACRHHGALAPGHRL